MASGVPVVARAQGGPAETVRDGDTGFLVAPDDLPAFVDRVELLVRDAELRTRMRARARAQAEDTTWDKINGRVARQMAVALEARMGAGQKDSCEGDEELELEEDEGDEVEGDDDEEDAVRADAYALSLSPAQHAVRGQRHRRRRRQQQRQRNIHSGTQLLQPAAARALWRTAHAAYLMLRLNVAVGVVFVFWGFVVVPLLLHGMVYRFG